MSGHTIHAPKGVGAIFVKKGVRLVPLHYGGEQEKKLRPGTEAIPLIAAMGVACGEFNIDKNYDYVSKLNSYAKDKLLKIDGVSLNPRKRTSVCAEYLGRKGQERNHAPFS